MSPGIDEALALSSERLAQTPAIAVGLQLDPAPADRVGLCLAAGRLLRRLRLRQDAEQVLHVMADLVRDHIGLREFAGIAGAAAEARLDLRKNDVSR